ncbi:MAG: flavin reductase [Bacteroidota bacterium]
MRIPPTSNHFTIFKSDELQELPQSFRRNFINSLSGYKSLCLAGTVNRNHVFNLAVMSSVIHVGANPPFMGMLFRPNTVPRNTLENIVETSFFTLNHVTEEFYKAAHQTSARYPEGESEFEKVGLEAEIGTVHPAPYVKAAPLQIGLAYQEVHRVQCNATIFLVGRIIEVRVLSDAVGEDGFIDLQKTGSLTVSGLDGYHRAMPISRLSYAKPDEELKEIPVDREEE